MDAACVADRPRSMSTRGSCSISMHSLNTHTHTHQGDFNSIFARRRRRRQNHHAPNITLRDAPLRFSAHLRLPERVPGLAGVLEEQEAVCMSAYWPWVCQVTQTTSTHKHTCVLRPFEITEHTGRRHWSTLVNACRHRPHMVTWEDAIPISAPLLLRLVQEKRDEPRPSRRIDLHHAV
jgi:hypothetical protein